MLPSLVLPLVLLSSTAMAEPSRWAVWLSPVDVASQVSGRTGSGVSAGWEYHLETEHVALRGGVVYNRLLPLDPDDAPRRPAFELDLLDVLLYLPLGDLAPYCFAGLGVQAPIVPKVSAGGGLSWAVGAGFELAIEGSIDIYLGVQNFEAYGYSDGFYDLLFADAPQARPAAPGTSCATADAGRYGLCYARTDPGFGVVLNPRLILRYRL